MSDTDADDLIARLSSGLSPADRAAFRRAAEAAVNSPGECWGEGLVHRTITAIWKHYFVPPFVEEGGRLGSRRVRSEG